MVRPRTAGRSAAPNNVVRQPGLILIRVFLCALFASVLVAQNSPGIAPTNNPPSGAVRNVEVPLFDCSGLPCIQMTTGSGQTLRLLIDTAEANSYLDTSTAQKIGVQLTPLQGGNGQQISEVQQTVVPGAKIGDLPMGDFPFMVLDAAPPPSKPGQSPIPFPADGALTYKAFENRLLELDYTNHLVRISEPQDSVSPCPGPCSNLVVQHFGNYGPVTLTTTGFSVNGQQVDAQIDTLFTGTMLIYPASVEKLGLKKESKGKQKETFPYTQNGIQLAKAEGASESFLNLQLLPAGPLYFTTSEDHPPAVQFDATIGSGLLAHAKVTFDFKSMHFWMDPLTTSPPTNPQQ